MPQKYPALAFLSLLVFSSASIAENLQTLTTEVSSGSKITTLTVSYSADNENLTGLGLRIHWNSQQLKFMEINNALKKDLLIIGQPQRDTDNYDNDMTTDWFVPIAWMNVKATWPGSKVVELLTLSFSKKQPFSDKTKVNFSASSTAANYKLNAKYVTISQ
ncbi:MAG: hypothetical protein KAU26_10035 [Methylococcales bacterium]|nr:hypothetical protein [Methylococcales bacterium]